MIAFGSAIGCQAANAEPQHAIAMHGAPAMPRDFSAMPYVNPDAPKGGRIVHGVLGTFDSLNPMIVKGLSIPQIRGYVIEGLMARGYNEPFTLYGLVAETIETDDKRSFITFNLNPKARFSDGHPVTPDDVVFSWQLLRDKGRPNYRTYYSKVSRVDITGPHSVRFDLSGSEDRELPLILGLMPVLPKHAIDVDRFEDTTFTPPIGSGPYIVKTVDPGRSVTLVRNPDYWGAKLPINRGLWNVDEIKADFYRDDNSYFEAFKKGLYDMRAETDPTRWQTGYDTPAYRAGRYVKEAFHDGLPKGMNALVFNTRRPVFADIRVREAIAMLFDFEWINKNFFFNLQKRTGSYFEGSELSSLGRPADERERDWLKSYPGAVRDDVLEGRYMPPKTNGSGRDREVLKNALTLFEEAGYELDGTVLRKRDTGQALTFEILVTSRDHERLALAFARDLKRAGITVQIRTVDAVQFDRRRLTYDFDMIPYRWDESLSPGNEQSFYWGSAAADIDGTRNYMGVKSPAIDAMIAHLLQARERDHFVSAVRALDRILISGFYVVPLFHLPDQWVARWTRIEHPKTTPLFGYLPEAWWHNPGAR
ncbi:extracellular solute-binding protein [Pseudorhodoplanes sinuspersici]|uniref:ABC transporter substrate-binding protein n=1 Tax=Pseudorhodoplanes sinuspersici TaxID=1235591 RepID=A0A1W7A0R2_9HYPH|nr:extracellular solute-binding protein [Pseudorhodoplanes sinuspersici]ARQ03156.1 ABC transporter substrate-binding protein [Pseudorhodoplanes sinuspersici]